MGNGSFGCKAILGAGRRECAVKADICSFKLTPFNSERSLAKKDVSHGQQKQLTEEIISDYDLPVVRACHLTGLTRSQFYHKSCKDDSEVITTLQELVPAHSAYGFRKMLSYLKRAGKP